VPEQPALRLVNPETGEVSEEGCPNCAAKDEEIAGLNKTLDLQVRALGRLERQLDGEESLDRDPKAKHIRALFERYKVATGKKTVKLGKPRVKLVRARLRDGFSLSADDEPSLELAIDGIAAYPYRVFNERKREGNASDRDDSFDRALQDEKHVESLSRYGWKARKAGWTPETGWPDREESDA
jgi:hypothetical protein